LKSLPASFAVLDRHEAGWWARRIIVKAVPKGVLALTAALAFSAAGVACSNARDEAAEAQREANEAQREANEKAQEARDEARDASRTSGGTLDAAAETMDVKTALMADDLVDASNINVDTFAETRTVVLRGSVPSQAQKDAAGRIAEREAEGYRVDNQLAVVTPRP
jgi:osmotically-inducible protein OsmY